MLRDEYNQAVLEAIGCEAEFEDDGSPLAVAIREAQAGRASGNTAQADAAIDRIVAVLAAVPFPPRVNRTNGSNDGGHGLTFADEQRDHYNTALLEEAQAFADDNGSEQDEELNAQISIVRAAWAAGDVPATDAAIDHLRGMLEISYCDGTDLPEGYPARGESATPAGRSDEWVEFTVRMTRAQIDAIYPALESICEHSFNRGESRAAEILLGSFPTDAQ